jgi:tellurium resistance protein TerZ
MVINLQKGQRVNLAKENGAELREFCVGCNWGMIPTGRTITKVIKKGRLGFGRKTEKIPELKAVDLDLSCIMLDGGKEMVDYIYSPMYTKEWLAGYHLPKGKLFSKDGALNHSGDDLQGDADGDDGLDNEIITVNLSRVRNNIREIFFFLNNVGPEDFSQIPYASIRMYEGTPQRVDKVHAIYDVAAIPQYKDKRALVMGKLYRSREQWRFAAIGDAFEDRNLCETIARIIHTY